MQFNWSITREEDKDANEENVIQRHRCRAADEEGDINEEVHRELGVSHAQCTTTKVKQQQVISLRRLSLW